jgi:hypothetical protein
VLYKYTGQSEQPLYYGVRGVDGKWSASELDDDVEGRPALCQGPSGSLWIAFCVRSNVLGNVYGHVFGTPSHNGDFTVSQTINCADPSISAGPAPGQVHVATSNSFDNLRAVVRASDDYAETWSSVGTALSSYPAFNVVSQTKDDGTTMVAFVEDPDVEGPKSASLQVYEHVAGKWKAVGAGQPVHDYVFDFALDDGDVPYLAYNHATNGAVVARLAGGSWERLGEALDEKWSNDFALAFAAESVPYVAMVGSYEVGKVLRYADAIGWEALGAKGYFDADVAELDMVIGAGNVPFVAYTRTFASEEPLIIKYQQ